MQSEKLKYETELWHIGLGHMGLKNLQILARKGILDKRKIGDMSFCENCVMGKHKKLRFHIGKHNTGEALSNMFMLISGALKTPRLPYQRSSTFSAS